MSLADRSHRPLALAALSGGVDSAVSALQLKERGFQVLAVHFLMFAQPRESMQQVERLAAHLQVDLEVVDLRTLFAAAVVQPFLAAYKEGRTPNPCVLCNPAVKFSALCRLAERTGAKLVATGHYARLQRRGDVTYLLKGADPAKDQSYFLYGLSQEQLRLAEFPVGDLRKAEVRQMAAQLGLDRIVRQESQEICFIPGNDYRGFLEAHLTDHLPGAGPIRDLAGRQLGVHPGIHHFTVGQRRGLRIPSSAPYYVLGLEPETNTVRVGRRHDLYRKRFLVSKLNWIPVPPVPMPAEILVRIRYRHRAAPARLEMADQQVMVEVHEPQRAVTPGQAAVFYAGDRVVGGGIIERVLS